MTIISEKTAPHYTWQGNCDAWELLSQPGMSVKQERMPSGATEGRHLHKTARQFFYVLSGALKMEKDGEVFTLGPFEGIEIPPGVPHQARNIGAKDVTFLVISSPNTEGDRSAC